MPGRLLQIIRFVCISSLIYLQAAYGRTWTDTQGRTLEAKLIEQSVNSVTVRRAADQREFSIPIDQLSAADRAYLAEIQHPTPAVEMEETVSSFPEAGLDWDNKIDVPDDFELIIVLEDNESNTYHYRSNHFDFHSNVKLARKVVSNFAEIFEATFALLQASPLNWNVHAPEQRFQAKLYETTEQYIADGGMLGSAGVYRSRTKMIYVPLDGLGTKKTSTSLSLDGGDHSTLIHEITHQVLDQWIGRMPTWLSEGYAEYIESLEYDRGSFRLSRSELDRRGSDTAMIDSPLKLIGLSHREWNAKFGTDSLGLSRQYRSAYLLTYYFLHLDGDENGQRLWFYLRALEKAKSAQAVQAAQTILLDGRSKDELFEAIRRAYRGEGLDITLY